MSRIHLPLAIILVLLSALPAQAIEKCAPYQPNTSDKHCVVDGDTLWLEGEKIRLRDFDTPEPVTNICGGTFEVQLADRASARLIDLLNTSAWTIERFGSDTYGRTLAVIRIGGRNVGDILIDEGLARSWPNGTEWWCD